MLRRTVVIAMSSGGLATVVLAVAVALAYRSYVDPAAELMRMAEAMVQVKTFQEKSLYQWTIEGDETKKQTLTLSGSVDVMDAADVRHATIFREERSDGGKSVSDVTGEVRTVDGETYLSVYETSSSRKVVEDAKWMSFEQGDVALLGYVYPALMPLPDAPWLPGSLLRWRDLLSTVSLFNVDHADLVEPIGGVVTRRFEVNFDPDGLRTFLLANAQARVARNLTAEEQVAVVQWVDALKPLSIRLWVGTKDHLLYRMQVEGGILPPGSSASVVELSASLSHFNEPVDVVKPESSVAYKKGVGFKDGGLRDFGSLISDAEADVESDGFASTETGGDIPKIEDQDADGLDDILEAFYGSDSNNPDTDGDGVSDGAEVKAMRSPTGSGGLYGLP